MSLKKHNKKSETDTIVHAVSTGGYLQNVMFKNISPFRSVPKYKIVLEHLLAGSVAPLRWFLKTDLMVENTIQGLYFIDARLREALVYLLDKGIVESWGELPNYPDAPHVTRFYVNLKLSGPVTKMDYYTEGYGVGETKNQALLTALAEALERKSSFVWDSKKIIVGSYEDLSKTSTLISPKYFSEKQIENTVDENFDVNNTDKVGWVKAVGLLDDKDYLIPAQMTYVLYGVENPLEKTFMDASTSGVAAGSSLEHAVYRAICEAIERDALMGFWLNRLAPPRINIESITVPRAKKIITDLKKYGFNIEILDITTEIGIPTYAAILLDPTNEVPVSMSAVTDLDKEQAIVKLLTELSKFAHYRSAENKSMGQSSEILEYSSIFTMEERRYVWSKPHMIKELDFFLKGKKVQFEIGPNEFGDSYFNKLEIVKKKIIAAKMSAYVTEITSSEAKHFGLHVVRVVMPDLIPIHFSEKRKHLGVSRVYEFPVKLGYSSNKSNEEDLNLTPHPFL